MKRDVVIVLALALLATSTATVAYNQTSHDRMTQMAYRASKAFQPAFWSRLGFGVNPTTSTFPDSTGQALTLEQLLMRGAYHADDWTWPVNHFFNPITGQGLQVLGVPVGLPAVDWALQPQAGHPYSLHEARQSYYDALTKPLKDDRDKAFGATFEALGHVAHVLQDTAQPQHVRNDRHLSWPIPGLHNPSLFESHADSVLNTYLFMSYPNAYQDGVVNSIGSPREFWQTGTSGTSGKGLAEFTNRNFVSQGSNFTGTLAAPVPAAGFPLPTSAGTQSEQANTVYPGWPAVPLDFVQTNVSDSLNSGLSTINRRASTFSVFDDNLVRSGKQPRFAYNLANIEAALTLLVPRAVAYSTGLIDYFFRGDIDIAPDDANMGKYVIRNFTSEAMSGTFELYYDAPDGNRYPGPGLKWTLAIPAKDSATGAPGKSGPIVIRSPLNARPDGVYTLVFRGDLGNEKNDGTGFGAVAGRKVKAVPLEALYIAGVDAQNRAITVRVDENGTQLLGGPDPSGVIKPSGGFDPIIGAALSGVAQNKKASLVKQILFPDGPGGLRYRVLAFQSFVSAGIRDTDSWDFSSGCCWEARSPDPALGKFTFQLTYNVNDASKGGLIWTRQYVDATGAMQYTSGVVSLPSLPGYASYPFPAFAYVGSYSGGPPAPQVTYQDLMNKGPVVSTDGLTVYGLATANSVDTGGPPGPVNNYSRHTQLTVNVISVHIQLAATPTATISVDETILSDWQSDSTATGGAEYQVDYACFVPGQILLRSRTDGKIDASFSYTTRGHIFVGAFDGDVRSYRFDGGGGGDHHEFYRYHNWAVGGICDYDIFSDDFSHKGGSYSSSVNHTMLDGPMTAKTAGDGKQEWGLDPNPDKVSHVHCDPPESGGQCRWTSFPNPGFSTNEASSTADLKDPQIVFAPYTNAVIYNSYNAATYTTTSMFRSMDLTGKKWVADASPLGEMFFALEDGSVIIHEPKGGRMPLFVKPPNMVRITAALWL